MSNGCSPRTAYDVQREMERERQDEADRQRRAEEREIGRLAEHWDYISDREKRNIEERVENGWSWYDSLEESLYHIGETRIDDTFNND